MCAHYVFRVEKAVALQHVDRKTLWGHDKRENKKITFCLSHYYISLRAAATAGDFIECPFKYQPCIKKQFWHFYMSLRQHWISGWCVGQSYGLTAWCRVMELVSMVTVVCDLCVLIFGCPSDMSYDDHVCPNSWSVLNDLKITVALFASVCSPSRASWTVSKQWRNFWFWFPAWSLSMVFKRMRRHFSTLWKQVVLDTTTTF